jgi:hypothetical protein
MVMGRSQMTKQVEGQLRGARKQKAKKPKKSNRKRRKV